MTNKHGENSALRIIKKHKKIIIVIGVTLILTAHIMGYKIFGEAPIIHNQPLKLPQKLQSINTSGEVILDTGKFYKIYGITTIVSNTLYSKSRFLEIQSPNREVEIETPDSTISKVWYKERIIYFGNDVISWYSLITHNGQFFPPRRPMFRRRDLAEVLVQEGLAIPDVELFEKDLVYARQLLSSIRNIQEIYIEQNEDKAIILGKYLCDKHPDLFNQGAWLLAQCNYMEIFEPTKKRLEELLSMYDTEVKTKGNYYSNPGYTIDSGRTMFDLVSILIKLSPEDSKSVLHKIIVTPRDNYLRVSFAQMLFGIGDIYGLDFLMEEVRKELNWGLIHELEYMFSDGTRDKYFKWDNFPAMYEWYQKNRLNLQSAANMHKILNACLKYADEHNGGWPDNLEALADYGITDDILANPGRPELKNGYIYIKPQQNVSPLQVVLYEAYDTWNEGINVAFFYGHIEFVTREDNFKKMLTR